MPRVIVVRKGKAIALFVAERRFVYTPSHSTPVESWRREDEVSSCRVPVYTRCRKCLILFLTKQTCVNWYPTRRKEMMSVYLGREWVDLNKHNGKLCLLGEKIKTRKWKLIFINWLWCQILASAGEKWNVIFYYLVMSLCLPLFCWTNYGNSFFLPVYWMMMCVWIDQKSFIALSWCLKTVHIYIYYTPKSESFSAVPFPEFWCKTTGCRKLFEHLEKTTPEDGMWLHKWRRNWKRSHTLPLLWRNAERQERKRVTAVES